MRKIESVLFDLDGTLVDTAPDLIDTLNRLLQQSNRPPLPLRSTRDYVSEGLPALLKLAFSLDQEHVEYSHKAEQFKSLYQQQLTQKSQLFAGVQTVLEQLQEENIPWGIVTNKPQRFTQPLVQYLQLDQHTSCCVSGDTLTVSKPDPAPLLYACQQLAVDPKHCLYVGDAKRDILAGQRANMQTVAALYGYRLPSDDPKAWRATHYIQHPLDLLTLLSH